MFIPSMRSLFRSSLEHLLRLGVMVSVIQIHMGKMLLVRYSDTHFVFLTGVVNFWDKDNKQRLKGFSPIERTIPCATFNKQGNLFAYASSYDWSKGSMHAQATPGNEIFIHSVVEEEIKPKSKTSGGYKR